MRPTGPMSRVLYRLTGVPRPMEHGQAVDALQRRAEREERRAASGHGRVRLIETGPAWNPPVWRQP